MNARRSEWDFLRERYYGQPREVSIETLALCNAACTFCPYPTLPRQGAKLPWTLWLKLVEQMSRFREPFFISPFKVNEPLLDARLAQMCHDIEALIPQARIRLFTNGSPLNAGHIAWIAQLKHLEHLWVSLNSCDPAEYRQLMHLDFEHTARRLDLLHDAGRKGEFDSSKVVVSRVCQHSAPDIHGRVEGSDRAFQQAVWARWPDFRVRMVKRDGWLGYVEPNNPDIPAAACGRWFEMNITAQGKAVLCCMDGKGEFVLGDCESETLLSIYNRPELRERRLKKNTREGIEPCARCTY